MKRVLFFAILLFFSFDLFAQSPAKILKQAEKALGGAKAIRNISSSKKTGTITSATFPLSGVIIMQSAQPNLYYNFVEMNGFESEVGFNGKSSWWRDSRDGLKTLTGIASVNVQAEAGYRNSLWLNYKKEKSKIVSCGNSTINEKQARCVNLVTAKGVSIKLYFDSATHLPVREEMPFDAGVRTSDFGDYRLVDGVMEAFSIRLATLGSAFDIKFEEITHNKPVARSVFDFPKILGEPLPDIPALLKELQANEDRTDAILESYAYTQKIVTRELGKDGVLREKESETYQLSFYKGNRIRRLVEKNGKPLSAKDQLEEDERVQKELTAIEKRIAKQEAENKSAEENGRVSVAEVLRASLLKNPRRERFRGRDVVVFDFEPNPDFDMKNAKSILKFFGKVGGVMWIDENDKQVARLEASLIDNYKIGGGLLANLKKGATFTIEQERVNDEIWLPSSADINISAKVLLVREMNLNQTVRSYNYKRFATEITDTKIDDVKKP